MMTPFKIKEIKANIFQFEFKNNYDMCMYFLRYQEYYESSSSKFRGKKFEIFDFMKWYSLSYGKGSFTYPDDWNGFNIPGHIIFDVWQKEISDVNKYDEVMIRAWDHCDVKASGQKFYIIGTVKNDKTAVEHEIAHGFFYLYPNYKKAMTKLVKSLDPKIRSTINAGLKKLGYTPKVYIDETQAYLSTGLSEAFGDITQWPAEQKVFQALFKTFTKETK